MAPGVDRIGRRRWGQFRRRTMSRIRFALVGVAAAAVLVASAAQAATTKLVGTVGPGFTISLKKGTKTVKMLKAGKYTIVVSDKSNIHNFRLKGPGLNKQITTVGFKGTKTVKVTLKKGKYTYDCDPHFASMHRSFTVS
jgi:plastocyanin